ncbi:MAG: hypothetical protein IIZ25_09165 [Thermoguttaceae bacterium]|nr:hypothetical protein [Thermoguttaceae bacterium]
MEKENGQWIMCGLDESDPECIGNIDELTAFVDKVGFVPLFQNSVPGFSVEEHTSPNYWWTGHAVKDPWQWRVYAAQQRRVAYGKFFGGKAGFISLKWLGRFANYRREGCDFYTLWREERVAPRQQKIMDCFLRIGELATYDIKKRAGFGRGGERGFEGAITSLQEKLFLVASDFRRRVTKQGIPYGWDVAIYALPEDLWGDDSTNSANQTPLESYRAITRHFKKLYPRHTERDIVSLIGKAPASPSPPRDPWGGGSLKKPKKAAVNKPAAKKAAAKKPALKKTAPKTRPAKRTGEKSAK